jgi:hypothetical protein
MMDNRLQRAFIAQILGAEISEEDDPLALQRAASTAGDEQAGL